MEEMQNANRFEAKEWRKSLVAMGERGQTALLETVAKLEKLLLSVDALRLFLVTIATDAFGPADLTSEAVHGHVPAKIETLAYYAYPFFGRSHEAVNPWHINECDELLEKIIALRLMLPRFPKGNHEPDQLEDIVTRVRIHAEFVRGSAFPEQTASEIVSVQGCFEEWFRRASGIGPTRAQAILWSIIRSHEKKMNSLMPDIRTQVRAAGQRWQEIKRTPGGARRAVEYEILRVLQDQRTAESFEFLSRLIAVAPEAIPVGVSDLDDLSPSPTTEEWEGLIRLVGMTKSYSDSITEIVGVRSRPLFVLPDSMVVLVDISNCLDALWDGFEQVAKTDESFFSGQYQKVRANWLEQRVVDCLLRIFPQQNVYRSLTYQDPDKTDGSTTELDAAVHWGPFLILLEAKAKQFRLESQLGDIGRLRSDIKANTEDAFKQASRAARYIEQTNESEFTESNTGRRLVISKDTVHRRYLVTVSQHHLAGLATRLSMFKDLGLFKGDEYPFSISIADLDTITDLSGSPDVFLHYVERRLAVQRELPEILADELDFFGAYLQTRLQPARLWGREDVKPDLIQLDGFSSQFDDWYSYKRGDLSGPPNIGLEIPQGIKEVLVWLRKRDDDFSRWISFALLDLSDGMLDSVSRSLADSRPADLTPGTYRRWTYSEGGTVVSILASLDVALLQLEQRTQMRAVIEKYRHKAAKSVSLGVMVRDRSKPFHSATWIEGPWEYDPEMEKLIQDEPPFLPVPGAKLPGRNDPCLCGSGKKFKKCCLPKMQAAKATLSRTRS
jgi:hypothetical protein